MSINLAMKLESIKCVQINRASKMKTPKEKETKKLRVML